MFIPTVFVGLITNALLLHCGYQSFKAIESKSQGDDTKWLTFWFVYSLFSFAKSILDYVSFVIPFYNEVSIGFVVYLGYFGGASFLYSGVLAPLLKQHEAVLDAAAQAGEAAAKQAIADGAAKATAAAQAAVAAATQAAAAQAAQAAAAAKKD